MIGLYILAGIIIFFCVLLSLNASIRVIYSSADTKGKNTRIYAQIGFYKFFITPSKQKKPKKTKKARIKRKDKNANIRKINKKNSKKKSRSKRKTVKKEPKIKPKPDIRAILGFSKDISALMFRKLRKYLKIKIYKLDIKVGSKDAYKTAMLYGKINQGAYYLYEILNNNFNIKARNMSISSDFTAQKLEFDIDVKVSIKIGDTFKMFISAAMCFMKFWSQSKDKGKEKNKNANTDTDNIKKESVEINGG